MPKPFKVTNRLKIAALVCALIALFLFWPRTHSHHLIAPRTSPSFLERPKNNAFVKAAGDGDVKEIEKLLASDADLNSDSTGDEGISALSAAAGNGQLATVEFLLSRGADVNAEDFWGGNALVGASLFGHVAVVRLLLAHGADPNMEDDGVTALDYASHQLVYHETKAPLSDYVAIVKALKANGARDSSSGPLGWILGWFQ